MFDQILNLVKEHIGNNPQLSSAIPDDKKDAVTNEISQHITNGIKTQAVTQGGTGGLLSMLKNAMTSGNPIANAIEGGLVSSLTSKFGLSPMATGAIAASLPALLQKFAHKANDPNDNSITSESITNAISNNTGGLGGFFNK